jgi:cell division inhibitor SulA/protein ImuA
MPALAALTKEDPGAPKKWVAWVAPPFVPYAPALQQHRVNIDRLLMIHPTSGKKNRLWAVEQVARSGSSAGVLAWVTAADSIEDVILRRLQLAAEEQKCWVVMFRPARARFERSPAALRIRVSQAAPATARVALPRAAMPANPPAAATRVEIIKCQGGRPGVVDVAGFALDAAALRQ